MWRLLISIQYKGDILLLIPMMLERRARKFLCTFLPILVRRQGGAGTSEHWDKHNTEVFKGIDPASQVLMDEIMKLAGSPETSIVDLGCNVGRHLDYLYRQGMRNLTGVDWSERAIHDMAERYPEVYEGVKMHVASFEDYLDSDMEPADIVYSRGATFELVHPSYPLIRKVAKYARHYVVLVISETRHAYPRFWEYEFAREGFELVHLRRPASMLAETHRVSLMTFRRL